MRTGPLRLEVAGSGVGEVAGVVIRRGGLESVDELQRQ